MTLLFWDASALIKRYFVEHGSDTVDELFAATPSPDFATTPWGYAETYSSILRRFNAGILDLASFTAAVTSLQAEVVDSPDFGLLSIDDAVIFASISTMRKHNLNATDAALLKLLLDYAPALPPTSTLCLVASDKRLLRAAGAEGLRTLNPESVSVTDVPAFLAGL
jgi:predicted nucleic acid-binding protein